MAVDLPPAPAPDVVERGQCEAHQVEHLGDNLRAVQAVGAPTNESLDVRVRVPSNLTVAGDAERQEQIVCE